MRFCGNTNAARPNSSHITTDEIPRISNSFSNFPFEASLVASSTSPFNENPFKRLRYFCSVYERYDFSQ